MKNRKRHPTRKNGIARTMRQNYAPRVEKDKRRKEEEKNHARDMRLWSKLGLNRKQAKIMADIMGRFDREDD